MVTAEELSKICRDSVKFTDVSAGVVKIDTPFLDSFNDEMTIYAVDDPHTSSIVLTDDGWTMDNLESRGFYLSASDKKQLEKYGVVDNDGSLQIVTTLDEFTVAECRLLQVMLAVDNMPHQMGQFRPI